LTPTGVTLPLPLEALDSPQLLAQRSAEQIRAAVNARAKEILSTGTVDAYKQFEDFASEYEVPIYRAWHVSDRPPNNSLLGFELKARSGGGAFGTVYRALSSDSEQVAVKILHQAVSRDAEMLQGFRRGARAMR